MVEVKRRPNESIGSLMRRFNRFVQVSGVLIKAKKSQFREKKKTERKEKNAAIMGMHLSKLRKKLEKLGKYDEETFEEEKRKMKQELDLQSVECGKQFLETQKASTTTDLTFIKSLCDTLKQIDESDTPNYQRNRFKSSQKRD